MEATEEPDVEATEEAMAPPAQESIVDVVANNEGFSTLLAAVENADPVILETLLGEGPYTVFAPTNDAFNNLLSTLDMSAEDLLAETDLLTQVLAYHVVAGEFFSGDVVGLDGEAAPTLLEDALIGITITEDGNVLLNDAATVTRADIDVTNGVVHVIDEVLLPQVVIDALGM
jgi:transforming growth factor-beta-induced protein